MGGLLPVEFGQLVGHIVEQIPPGNHRVSQIFISEGAGCPEVRVIHVKIKIGFKVIMLQLARHSSRVDLSQNPTSLTNPVLQVKKVNKDKLIVSGMHWLFP